MKSIITIFTLLIMLNSTAALANQADSLDEFYINKRGQYQSIERANIFTHKHVLKFSVRYSREQGCVNRMFKWFDTENTFDYQDFSPIFSFAHEIYLENIFSLAYSIGYSKNEIRMNSELIQTFQGNLFVHPKLNYYRSKFVEAYFQLNIGLEYNNMDKTNIKNEGLKRNLTPTFKLFTGVTPIGLNFKLSKQVWFNVDVSILSYERISCGLKIKLKDNTWHPQNWVGRDL